MKKNKIGHHKYHAFLILFCFITVTSSLGCEVFKSIKDRFSKTEEKNTAKEEKQQSEAPKEKAKSQPTLTGNTVAVVGNWSLTLEEFNDRLEALKEVVPDFDLSNLEARELVLEELVRQQLLVNEAERSGLANSKDIVAAVEEFRRTVIVRELARGLVEDVKVSSDEAREFYDLNKDLITQPGQWQVREIKLDSESKANEIKLKIQSGEDFASLAREHSKSDTSLKGGDLGFINDVPFEQMAAPLLALSEGETSDVFQGPDGYYIIKLEDKQGGEQIPFEEVKNTIIQQITLDKQQKVILEYINELREKGSVEINSDLLK